MKTPQHSSPSECPSLQPYVPGAIDAKVARASERLRDTRRKLRVLCAAALSSLAFVLPAPINAAGCAGSLDPSLKVPDSFPTLWSWYPPILAMRVQSDGKVLIADATYDFALQLTSYLPPIRFNADGSLDNSYLPNSADVTPHTRVVQPDGKVLEIVPGFNGAPNQLLRFNVDGSRDASFVPGLPEDYQPVVIALQPDGRIVLGGGVVRFRQMAGVTKSWVSQPVVRLLENGAQDATFFPGLEMDTGPGAPNGSDSLVRDLVVAPEGRIYFCGFFTRVSEVARTDVARLNPDGTLDLSFEPDIAVCTGCDIDAQDTVSALGIAPDGKLVIAGRFTQINGVPSHAVARLHTADADCPGVISFATAQSIVPETNGVAVVTVLRQGGTGAPVTVRYYTYTNDHPQFAEATQFEDYPPTSGTLLFAPGETSKTLLIPIIDDPLCEPNERIWLALQSPDNGALLRAPTNACVLVIDDEAAGRPGNVDVAFEPDIRVFSPWDGVRALAADPEGIWIAGLFDLVDGLPRNGLARLQPNGRLNASFNPALDGNVAVFAFDAAGTRMLVGGNFTNVDGNFCPGLARFKLDGTLDTTFHPPALGAVSAINLQANGKMVVAGSSVARLNPDGTSDATFHGGSPVPVDGTVYSLAAQPDGKVIAGGLIFGVEGQPIEHLVRFNADGSLDAAFVPVSRTNSGFINVSGLALQPDGKILVAGYFDQLQGLHRVGLARLNANGTIDASFNPGSCGVVDGMVVQPDGKILIAAEYADELTLPNRGVMRLLPDGSPDPTFFVAWVPPWFESRCLALQSNGDVLIGGVFAEANGLPRPGLARLHGDITGRTPDDAGSITFSAPEFSVPENGGPAVVKVRRIWGSRGAVSATFRTRDETAASGLDFSATSGRVSFADGEAAEKAISIPIVDDQLGETDESFELLLGNATGGATLGSFARARVTIVDNEEVVQFDSPAVAVFETNAYVRVSFMVTGRRDIPLTVEYATHDGTAKAGVDYEPLSGTRTLEGAGYGGSMSIHLLTNLAARGTRTFSVSLRVTSGTATLGPNSVVTVYILDTQVPTGPGSIDLSFDPTLRGLFSGFGGPYPLVSSILLQPDGMTLVAGSFYKFNDLPCRGLVRLNKDGGMDWDFAVPPFVGLWSGINALALDPSGKIFVAFDRTMDIFGQQYGGVLRLNPDGTLDPGFHTPTNIDYSFINAVAVQKDGKVLLGGVIPSSADQPYRHILRFNPDGSLDRTFQPVPLSSDGEPRNGVNNILVEPDCRIVLLGGFGIDVPGGTGLVRLWPDGRIDTNFMHGFSVWTESSGTLARQPDGKYIIGAPIWDGAKGYGMARLNSDGTIDSTFVPPTIEREVRSLALLPDGTLLVATNQWDAGGLMHLCADGSINQGFHNELAPSEGAFVSTIAPLPNGQVLIGGRFGLVNGFPAQNIARLNTGVVGVFVARQLPYRGGSTVGLLARPAPSTTTYAVQDQPPAGWQVANISDGGMLDPVTGQVKFGPFFDNAERDLRYDALPPVCGVYGLCGVFTFIGDASADGLNRTISGDSLITVAGLTPSDVNPADSRISIDEVTAYGAAWRKGERWPIDPNPIPINYATRAAALWRWGESYTVDRSITTEPLWWVPSEITVLPLWHKTDLAPMVDSAQRECPGSFIPGETLKVTIHAVLGPDTVSYAVEEKVPAGWTVDAISDNGCCELTTGTVRWGPFLDGVPRVLSYQVTPFGTSDSASLSGRASFDGRDFGITGPMVLREACRLTVVSGLGSGQATLALAGRAGGIYQIETSTDLRSWTLLKVINNTQCRTEFPAGEVSPGTQCFYRARLLQ